MYLFIMYVTLLLAARAVLCQTVGNKLERIWKEVDVA
jgi:hypothetical protein